MKIKNKKDFGLGVFCLLFASWVTYLSMQLKSTGYQGDPGPRMFPLIGAVIVAVCGIALIIAPEKEQKFLSREQWKAAFRLFGLYVLLSVMLWLFGFVVAVPVALFLATFMLSGLSVKDSTVKKRLFISLVYGIVGGAVLWLAYVKGLRAAMPAGVLWKLLGL